MWTPQAARIRERCKFDQARQEPGQRFPRSRRRDQQRRQPLLRASDEFQLMAARTPAAAGEPRLEARRQGEVGGVHTALM